MARRPSALLMAALATCMTSSSRRAPRRRGSWETSWARDDRLAVQDLPIATWSGGMFDVRTAVALRPELKPLLEAATAGALADHIATSGLMAKVTDLLLAWAGTAGLTPTSRGEFADAVKLAALEAYTATPFVQAGSVTNPTVNAGNGLDAACNTFVRGQAARLAVQGDLGSLLGDTRYDFETDRIVSTFPTLSALAVFKSLSIDALLPRAGGVLGQCHRGSGRHPGRHIGASIELRDHGERGPGRGWLGGFASALRNPMILPETANFYLHRSHRPRS